MIAVSFLKHGVMQVHGKALNQFITPDMFTYQIVAPTVYHILIELWRLKISISKKRCQISGEEL